MNAWCWVVTMVSIFIVKVHWVLTLWKSKGVSFPTKIPIPYRHVLIPLDNALQVFEIMPKQDVVTWNAIIVDYFQNDKPCSCFHSQSKPVSTTYPRGLVKHIVGYWHWRRWCTIFDIWQQFLAFQKKVSILKSRVDLFF